MSGIASAGHGMSRAEADVMALWDAGCSVEEIAAALPGKSASSIQHVIHAYGNEEWETIAFEAMIRRGDAVYQRALVASGGRYR